MRCVVCGVIPRCVLREDMLALSDVGLFRPVKVEPVFCGPCGTGVPWTVLLLLLLLLLLPPLFPFFFFLLPSFLPNFLPSFLPLCPVNVGFFL